MASAELDIQIPGYCINRRIGAGATGTVYEAEEQHGGKGVVIKIIHPHLVRKESVREAFLQAVTIVISLDHPGVVPALMAGEAERGGLYVVSACAEGSSLTDLLAQKGALSEKRALALLADLAGVLSVAHEAKLVHGNLTPENIWVRGDAIQGRVSVMDFGMAPLHVAAGDEEQRPPYYLSPEQIKGEAPSVRSDVYALGILAFQLLTGRLPFSSPKPRDVLLMHLNDEPPPPQAELAPLAA